VKPATLNQSEIEKISKIMKPIMWVGVLLIVLGALGLAYQGFNYTHQERVLDVGPIHATAEEHDRVSIPPALGGLALVGGIVLLVVGAKKNS
jgi:hypothetical protein